MKYIVSFTTSPIRIQKCEPMLKSILNQTKSPDLIILNIPTIFQRTGEKYNIPKYISDNVFVNRIDQDLGPATKIVPTIQYLNRHNYNPNDTRIIYVDDDIKYMHTMIETLDHVIDERDHSVWASAGFNFIDFKYSPKRIHGEKCCIAEGYGGVCVKLSMFHKDFQEYIDKYINNVNCRLSDDVILSNYYHKKNVDIKIIHLPKLYSITDMWKNLYILNYGNQPDALHLGANGSSTNNVDRYKKVISILNKNSERYFDLQFMLHGNIIHK